MGFPGGASRAPGAVWYILSPHTHTLHPLLPAAGCILIGETGLEEVMENLIMDGLDLSGLGPRLLDPEVDLDDIYD